MPREKYDNTYFSLDRWDTGIPLLLPRDRERWDWSAGVDILAVVGTLGGTAADPEDSAPQETGVERDVALQAGGSSHPSAALQRKTLKRIKLSLNPVLSCMYNVTQW